MLDLHLPNSIVKSSMHEIRRHGYMGLLRAVGYWASSQSPLNGLAKFSLLLYSCDGSRL
jgi:hypothetical protein